jgi:hypothetical protein
MNEAKQEEVDYLDKLDVIYVFYEYKWKVFICFSCIMRCNE